MSYDLLVKGGFVIDPAQGIEEEMDVAISNGRIAEVAKSISNAKKVIDASEKVVVPGLIDLHTHLYKYVTLWGVDADADCLGKGVTTAVDAGSSGCLNYEGFRKLIVDQVQTRVLTFLHISSVGLTPPFHVGELQDFRNLDFEKALETAKENRGNILGIKIRLGKTIVNEYGPQALRLAKEVAKGAGVPLMVHPGVLPENLPFVDVLKVLEKGDIVTHCLPPPYPPTLPYTMLFDEKGEVLQEVWKAIKRGIIFDVGHGAGSFSFQTAEKAIKQGLLPATISTDLHTYSIKYPVYDLPTTLSKFLHLGLTLPQVIERCTAKAAQVLGLDGKIGTLKPGAEGDVTILKMIKGKFEFWDVVKNSRIGERLLKTITVIKGGRIIKKDAY